MKISVKLLKKTNTIRLYSINKEQKECCIELTNNLLFLNSNDQSNNQFSDIKINSHKKIAIKTKTLKFNCKELKINANKKILIKNFQNEFLLNNNIKMTFENIEFKGNVFKMTSPFINFFV